MTFASTLSFMRRHEILRTSSPDEALETMSQFGARVVRPLPGRPFHLRVGAMKLKHVLFAHGNHGAGTNTGYDTGPHFWQSFVISGHCMFEAGGTTVRLDRKNWSALVGPHRYLESRTGSDYQQFTVKIDTAAVGQLLSAWSGQDSSAVEIQQQADVNSPMLQSMRRSAFFLAGEMDAIASTCSELAIKEFEQSFILNFLLGHRHNFTPILLRKPAAPSSSQLDMVETYIRDNCDKPLEAETLAAVANVSARSIFRYFRERRGCSPAQYIKKLRLQHAHDMFISAGENSSVIAIAAKAGFVSPGHFARDYRAEFGEKPSETVARAHGRSSATRRSSS